MKRLLLLLCLTAPLLGQGTNKNPIPYTGQTVCTAQQEFVNNASGAFYVCKNGVPTAVVGSGTVTTFTAGTLSPIFTTGVATATTTPALTFTLSNAAAFTFLANNSGSSAAPSYTTFDSVFGSCSTASSALTFNTSTHLFGCNSISGAGTVTHTGNLTLLSLVVGNGTADEKIDTGCSTDGAGALTCVNFVSSGTTAGAIDFTGAVTDPAQPSNSVGWLAPASATFTKYRFRLPSTAPSSAGIFHAGAVASSVSAVTVSAVVDADVSFTTPALGGATATTQTASDNSTKVATTAYVDGRSAHGIEAALLCSDSSGSGTTQVCSTSPTFTPAAGDTIIYKTTTQNSGALTLNVNSLGAKAVQKWQGTALASGDLKANVPVVATYDGTNWQLSTIGNAPSGGSSGVAVLNGYCAGAGWASATTSFSLTGLGATASGSGSCGQNTAGTASIGVMVTHAGTLKNLCAGVLQSGAKGSQGTLTLTVTVYSGGVTTDTALTITDGFTANFTACDSTHTAAVLAGDVVAIKILTSATIPNAGSFQASVEFQ